MTGSGKRVLLLTSVMKLKHKQKCLIMCVILVFFSPQPHLCDPSLHLDPDSCYFTGPHSYSANHFSAHPPERNPPHCHGNSDSLHFAISIHFGIIFEHLQQ